MSLPPRFIRHDGSFEDWAEGYWNGCIRPDEKTETIARHAFDGGKDVGCAYAMELSRAAERALHWDIAEGSWSAEQPERDALRAALAKNPQSQGGREGSAANTAPTCDYALTVYRCPDCGKTVTRKPSGITVLDSEVSSSCNAQREK